MPSVKGLGSKIHLECACVGQSGVCIASDGSIAQDLATPQSNFLLRSTSLANWLILKNMEKILRKTHKIAHFSTSNAVVYGIMNSYLDCPRELRDLVGLIKNSESYVVYERKDKELIDKCVSILRQNGARIWENWSLRERIQLQSLEEVLGIDKIASICGRPVRKAFELTREEIILVFQSEAARQEYLYACAEILLHSGVTRKEVNRESIFPDHAA
jgi:hypothetical protein